MTSTGGHDRLISVIIPVFQNAATLEAAVQSILAQTYPRFEVILVDDGSTDASPSVISALAAGDARVKPLLRPHEGQVRAVLAGLAVAQGEYIARMDADDLAAPDRLQRQVTHLAQTGAAGCGGWAQCFGADQRLIRFPASPEAMRLEALFRSPLLDPTLMIRASVLRAIPYRPEDRFLPDMGLVLRLIERGAVITNLPLTVLQYRRHDRQLSMRAGLAVHRFRVLLSEAHFRRHWPQAADSTLESLVIGASAPDRLEPLQALGEYFTRFLAPSDHEARIWLVLRWLRYCHDLNQPGPGLAAIGIDIAERLLDLDATERQCVMDSFYAADDRADALVADLEEGLFARRLGWSGNRVSSPDKSPLA